MSRRRQRRYSLISRLIGMMACMALVVIGLTWWLAGFSLYLGLATVAAFGGLLGPAAVESGGGLMDFLSGILELIGEALTTILEAIEGLFSGFG